MAESVPESRRFVIQRHSAADGLHWDWMLEGEGGLWTWRVALPPGEIGAEPVEAERIHEHPLRFLTYEGPVQKNTGSVKIEDSGAISLMEISDGRVVFGLEGRVLSGQFEFHRQPQGGWILQRLVPRR